MSKQKRMFEEVLPIAEHLAEELAPVTTRLEIAGSLRRKTKEVGDIEIVCIAEPIIDLFGEPQPSVSVLHHRIQDLADGPLLVDGPKMKKFRYSGIQVDLFIATPDSWGLILMLRTGSAAYSRMMVTPHPYGRRPWNLAVKDGYVWNVDEEGERQLVPVPSEEDLYRLWGWPWDAPEKRDYREDY